MNHASTHPSRTAARAPKEGAGANLPPLPYYPAMTDDQLHLCRHILALLRTGDDTNRLLVEEIAKGLSDELRDFAQLALCTRIEKKRYYHAHNGLAFLGNSFRYWSYYQIGYHYTSPKTDGYYWTLSTALSLRLRQLPPYFELFDELNELDLSHILLRSLPDYFHRFQHLERLKLNSNELRSLPPLRGAWRNMSALHLGGNPLRSLPEDFWAQMPHLRFLDLSHTHIRTLHSVEQHAELVSLAATHTRIERIALPPSLVALIAHDSPHLTHIVDSQEYNKKLLLLDAHRCGLQTMEGRYTALRFAVLGHNQLQQTPHCLQFNLRLLCLNNNQLQRFDGIKQRLGSLHTLRLANNRLEHFAEEESTKTIPHLRVLQLHGNRLRRLPDWLGKLGKLRQISLHNNLLEALPADISGWQLVQRLALGGNRLRGLPDSIAALKGLRNLVLSDNTFDEVPEAVYGCVGLRTLHLANNRIECLSEGIGQLSDLRVLILRGNRLRGLAAAMAGLRNLQFCDLRDNVDLPPSEIDWLRRALPSCTLLA